MRHDSTFCAKRHRKAPFFPKPFLRYWYDNSAILRLIFQADRAYILSESLAKMMNQLQASIKLVHPATKYSNYFFALRSAIPLAVLAEWVRNDINIASDYLSDVLFNQLQEVIKFNQME
ncbi:hypothetical protein [Paenibacillus cymbidii]|uniref:hypothetical protein n=1 Tax=Paenibacillus cymbidii TaxID=1639034 RepID=UPI00108183F8|nr:hypothetical protein [Paenibacillus cymbidii]